MFIRLSRLCLVLAVAASATSARAQSPSDFDAPYERLVLAETQTRVLANRRAIFLDPGRQDGTIEAEALRPLQWEVLYGQMRTASEDVRSLPSAEALAVTAATARSRRQLPIAVVWQPFDFIDQTAVDDGRLLVDESGPVPQVYRPDQDAFGAVAASPYQQASVFAAGALYGGDLSAALHGPVAVGGTLTMVIPRGLFVVPVGYARPSFVEVSAGKSRDAQTVALDQPFSLSFSTPGTKWVRLTAVVGGATRHAAFELHVRERSLVGAASLESVVGASSSEGCASRAVEANWSRVVCGITPAPSLRWRPRRRYSTVNNYYQGRKSADYDYGVIYSPYNFSGRLRRPIVIVGGYDSMEDAGLDDLYRQLVQFDNPETTGPVVDFDQALLEAGYDLVFMDFADSHDYIQRNGLALVDLLRTLQVEVERNPSGEEIAGVIGYSMGGLVARYGLAYMESMGEEHGVGLFVSYDTPHQGALMPVGLETLLADLYAVLDRVLDVSALYASEAGGPDFVERRLYGPALQQLLTFWAGDNAGASDPSAVRTRIRRDFYDDLMSLGDYPEQLRRVAISNGNGRGRRQIRGQVSRGTVERMQPAEQTLLVEAGLSLLWGAFGTRIELRVQNAAAPGGTAQVYRRRDVTRFLGVPIYSTAQQNTLTLPNPYDIVPGSFTETYSVIRKQTAGGDTRESLLGTLAFTWLGAGAYYNVQVDADRHAFVPTASALDWNTRGGSRENLVSSTFRRQNLSGSINRARTDRSTPFDAILTADDPYFDSGVGPENQPHLFVTEGIEAFVLDQLGREAPDRSAPFIRGLIDGPGSLNAGGSGTWQVNTRSGTPPFTYQWNWAYTCEPSNDPDDGAAPTLPCDETLRDGGSGDRMTSTLPDHGTALIAVSVEDAAGQMTEAFQTVTVAYVPSDVLAAASAAGSARTGAPLVFAARVTPNPSRDRATLRVDLPEPADVVAEVYDTLGRLLQTTKGPYPAGSHALEVETADLGRGTYLYRVRAGAEATSGTFTVVR